MLEIERGPARSPRQCPCCGGAVASTHGQIHRDGQPFALYQAAWSEAHPEDQVNARIEIGGDWGDASSRPAHVYFGLLIFRRPGRNGFSMLEPAESMWFFPREKNTVPGARGGARACAAGIRDFLDRNELPMRPDVAQT